MKRLLQLCWFVLPIGLIGAGTYAGWQYRQLPPLVVKAPKAIPSDPSASLEVTAGPPAAYHSHLQEGQRHMGLEQYDLAIKELRSALSYWPEGQVARQELNKALDRQQAKIAAADEEERRAERVASAAAEKKRLAERAAAENEKKQQAELAAENEKKRLTKLAAENEKKRMAELALEKQRLAEATRKREAFEEKLTEGKSMRTEKKMRAALIAFDAALKLMPDDAVAKKLRDEAKRTLDDFKEKVREGERSKDAARAVAFLKAALEMVADDPDARVSLGKREKELALKTTPLEGDVLVLVLHTNAKKSSVGTDAFNKQLADLTEKYGKKLLEGGIHVLTNKGVRKWSPGLKLSDDDAFDNEKGGPLFTAAFQAITKTTERARNKGFKTVFVWETDFDPTGAANPKLAVPPKRELRLCYRFTDNRDNDMREPGNLPWYGLDEDKAKRIASVENLKGFVEYLIEN